VTTELDGSNLHMVIGVSTDGVVEVVVVDDYAPVCSGTPSTMIGAARTEGDTMFVNAAPVLSCDDGSQPEESSSPQLEEQLDNLSFTHDPMSDTLTGTLGSTWTREGAEIPNTPGINWPQTNLQEVEEAQALADAGDPDYAWQLVPNMESILEDGGQIDTPQIFTRFLRKEFGWKESALIQFFNDDTSYGGFPLVEGQLIRCEPGKSNPLWPDDPKFGRCAPTIDDFHYEWATVSVTQPGQRGPDGIWVASFSTKGEALLRQMAPITEGEIGALVEGFLQARIAGEGAEQYLGSPDDLQHFDVGFLYATSTGAPYEQAEFEIEEGEIEDQGPLGGGIGLKVRLFAEGGQTVVEQSLNLEAQGDNWLLYQHEDDQSTENGVPLPTP
jgi:hypothetical protein